MTIIKNIAIPSPCTQSWNNMTTNGVGRHCTACAKTVVDFSLISNDQIINYLSSNTKTCGKFDTNQLEMINAHLLQANRHNISGMKRWGLAMGFLSLLNYFKADAQIKEPVEQVAANSSQNINTNKNAGLLILQEPPIPYKVTGHVLDKNDGSPIPGVSILIEGTNTGTMTDATGKFMLTLPDNANKLRVAFVGYQTQTLFIDRTSLKPLEIKMEDSSAWLGEVVVVQRRPGVFKRVTNWFKRL